MCRKNYLRSKESEKWGIKLYSRFIFTKAKEELMVFSTFQELLSNEGFDIISVVRPPQMVKKWKYIPQLIANYVIVKF